VMRNDKVLRKHLCRNLGIHGSWVLVRQRTVIAVIVVALFGECDSSLLAWICSVMIARHVALLRNG
jgi:hypothetical protein